MEQEAFVGRERELRELRRALDSTAASQGHLVLISGEPGIGKSRLVDEFAVLVRARGLQLLTGRCWDAGGAPAYWPWVQALRSHLRREEPDRITAQIGSAAIDIVQMLPEIRELFPDLPTPPSVDPDSARFQLFDSTASFLRNVARTEPVVLVLEDLHAADTPSLLLLRFLAEQLYAQIMVLGTYRDVELTPDHPLTATVAELSRQPSCKLIRLRGLTHDDVVAFVGAVSGEAAPSGLALALHRETKGNPLFITEALRLLSSEGRLQSMTDLATFRIAVPKSVRDVIGRRVGGLDEYPRRVLSLASVLGSEFAVEPLRLLGDMSRTDLLDALGAAVSAGLLEPAGVGRFRFSHELVRETLYQELAPVDRMALHRKSAELLMEARAATEEPHLAELARHLFEALPLGDAAMATDYAGRAAAEAAQSLAYEEAVRLYAMALRAAELIDARDEDAFEDLLLALGEAQARAGEMIAARETFLRAGRSARRTGRPRHLARAALGYGGRELWARAGDDPHIIPMLQDALALLGGSDDLLRVRVLTRLACALRSSPDRERSDALSREAVEMARALGDPATLAYALVGRCWAIYWPEGAEERLGLAGEAIQVAEEAGDSERIFEAHQARCAFLTDVSAVADAHVELDTITRMSKDMRQPAQRWLVRWFTAGLALLEGEFDAVESLFVPKVRLSLHTLAHDDSSAHHMVRFLLAYLRGGLVELEARTRAVAAEVPWYPCHRAALVLLLLEVGRDDEARGLFDELAAHDFHVFQRDCMWLLGICLLSEGCSRLGRAEAATPLYDLLSPFRGRLAVAWFEGTVGAVDRYLGLLAATSGRPDDAIGHLVDAIALNDRMRARPWAAHSRFDLAAVLLRRDGPGDLERAVDELHSARETSERLGMPVLAEKVSLLLWTWVGERGPKAQPLKSVGPAVFRREGEYWTVVFEDDAFRLKDTKGLRYLAVLLHDPGREFHVMDLVRSADRGIYSVAERDAPVSVGLGNAGAQLDPAAKEAYRRRLTDLEEDIAEAEGLGDADRAERARSEREFIARELASALGLGGRDRVAASASERARVNVTRSIKAALARIAGQSSALGRHLEATIRTGTFCSYVPDPRAGAEWRT
jgi:tetratricopeptide (TPR) repeat protein